MMRRKRETPCISVDYSFFVLLSNWQTYDSEGFHAQKNQHIFFSWVARQGSFRVANLCEFSAPYNAKKGTANEHKQEICLATTSLCVEVRSDKRPGRARTKR